LIIDKVTSIPIVSYAGEDGGYNTVMGAVSDENGTIFVVTEYFDSSILYTVLYLFISFFRRFIIF
jgi:hypothetical protein